jgi:hypothetical protein
MSKIKLGLLLCLLIAAATTQATPSNPTSQFFSDYRQGIGYKKGLTFEATVWPA